MANSNFSSETNYQQEFLPTRVSTPGPAYHTWDISEENNMGTGDMEEKTTTRYDVDTYGDDDESCQDDDDTN